MFCITSMIFFKLCMKLLKMFFNLSHLGVAILNEMPKEIH